MDVLNRPEFGGLLNYNQVFMLLAEYCWSVSSQNLLTNSFINLKSTNQIKPLMYFFRLRKSTSTALQPKQSKQLLDRPETRLCACNTISFLVSTLGSTQVVPVSWWLSLVNFWLDKYITFLHVVFRQYPVSCERQTAPSYKIDVVWNNFTQLQAAVGRLD